MVCWLPEQLKKQLANTRYHYFVYIVCMKICLIFLFACAICVCTEAQTGAASLIPAPVNVQETAGCFTLSANSVITAPAVFKAPAALLAAQLGLSINTTTVHNPSLSKKAGLYLFSDPSIAGKEAYRLSIHPNYIAIKAATVAGMQKGIFSLLQLRLLQTDMQRIPCAEITDSARFAYRGLQLDVSRNFFPPAFIKKYIDLMALYKYNTFHWHLTDNGGWRLQIKKYPLLTRFAAFRTRAGWKDWWLNGRQYLPEGDPLSYGLYYTQPEAREIVAYATLRGITVIPEIEMPAHSEEVLAAYPQLSCSGLPYKNAELCIGNNDTFTFLQDVLTEVMDIFPSAYIHVGGDEASTSAWQTCVKCQARKKQEGLQTDHDLQAYLMKRIQNFLAMHNRKLMGWDEVLQGDLAADAAVMSWRGEKYTLEAARQNHPIVITANEYYLDGYQSDPNTQPESIGGYLPLQRIYDYEPVPLALPAEKTTYISGAEACVWTEYMPTTYQVEYMVYPRAIALAETAWSGKEKKNFNDFQERLQQRYRLLQRMEVNYYRPSTLLTLHALPDTIRKQDLVSFTSEQYKPDIHFTMDGSAPVLSSPVFTRPFYTEGKTNISAVIFRNGIPTGPAAAFTANYHKAIGKKVTYNTAWSDAYPAQREATLTNGIEGSLTYGDKQWLGYLKDFDVTVDMDSVQQLNSLSIRFMQQPGPGVFLPSSVEILFSTDGKNFTSFSKQVNSLPFTEPKTVFKSFSFDLTNSAARFLRVIAVNVKKEFMFTDEIIIY